MTKRGVEWWVRCIVHNSVIHPILPIAELLETMGMRRFPKFIYDLHDATVPEGGG